MAKIRAYLIFFAIILIVSRSSAQEDLDKYLEHFPTVPEATVIEKFGDFSPPNSYGIVPVGVPLLSIGTKSYKIPVSLKYISSGGVKVAQESSKIGLGWLLNINNFYIEKIINGYSDGSQIHNADVEFSEIETRKNSTNSDTVLGLYYNLRNNILGGNIYMEDFLADEYTYSFNGISGNFIFDENGEILNISSSNNDIRIIRTNNGFELTDEHGNIFHFNKEIEFNGNNSTRLIKERWYLSQIVSYEGETIDFSYTDGNAFFGSRIIDGKSNTSYRDVFIIWENLEAGAESKISDYRPDPQPVNNGVVYQPMNSLKEVIFPNGKLSFNYAKNTKNQVIITGLTLYKVNPIGNYEVKDIIDFENDGFFKNIDDPNGINICPKLNAVTFLNSFNEENKQYRFEYINDSNLPDRNSVQGDYWGYYAGPLADGLPEFDYFNSGNNQQYHFPGNDRSPNFIYTKTGILNKIYYPTGGYSEFVYEPNYYSVQVPDQSNSSNDKTIALTAIGKNPAILSPKPIDSISFYLDYNKISSAGGINVTYSSSRFVKPIDQTNFPYIKVITPNNTYSEIFHIPTESKSGSFNIVNVPSGKYTAIAYVGEAEKDPNDPQPSIFNTATVELVLKWSEYPDPNDSIVLVDKLMTGGGLRIKEIRTFEDEFDNILSLIKKYEYGSNKVDYTGIGKFMGIHTQPNIVSPVNGSIKNEDHLVAHFLTRKSYKVVKNYDTGDGGGVYQAIGLQLSSEPQFSIAFKGHSVFYDQITEYNISTNGTNNGKKEFFYSSPIAKKIHGLDGDWNNSVQSDLDLTGYSPFSGSHLLKEIVYNSNGSKIIEKKYNYITETIKDLKRLKLKLSDHILNEYGSSYASDNRLLITKNLNYYTYFEEFNIDKLFSIEKTRFFNGNPIVTTTENQFVSNESFRISETTFVGSNNNSKITNYYYPDEVSSVSSLGYDMLETAEFNAIDRLKSTDFHRIGPPVQMETKTKDSQGNVLSNSVNRTIFEDSNGIVLPKSIETLKGADPNAILEPRIKFHRYDLSGNPLEVSKQDGSHIIYLWGYNDQHPIAMIKNAAYAEVANALSAPAGDLSNIDDTDMASINALRGNLSKAQVTTYTYEPLVGIKSITDPKGQTITYHYDSFNQLEFVKDEEGNILKEHQYHYKTNQP